MLTQKNHLKTALVLLGATTLLANCAPQSGATSVTDSTSQSSQSTTSTSPQNMKISMTSVSSSGLQNLFLNIARVDVLLSKNNQSALVNVAKNLGVVDLQSLQNGLSSQLANIALPAGFNLQQINLVLGQTGNTAVDLSGNQCQLQIPGGLGNILPLSFGQGLNISGNSVFNLLMGLNTQSAITSLGNGTCVFNPTLGLASAYKFDLNSILGSVGGGSMTGLSNPQDILGSLFPQLGQVQGSTSSAGGLLGTIIGSLTGGLAGGTSSSSGAALINSLLSGLLANGGINNVGGALSNGQVSLPINLATGQFATGSGVGSLISALLQQQVQNNTSAGTPTLGSVNSPLQLTQLLAMFGL